jgi:hypothetical protein
MASRSPSISLSTYRIVYKSTSRFKSCMHLRSLNVRHFEMVEATGLKVWHWSHLQRHQSIQNFIQIHQSVQKVRPPQKFKRPPLWNGWSYGNKIYDIQATFNFVTVMQNLIQTHEPVQNFHPFQKFKRSQLWIKFKKKMASRSPLMTLPPRKISSKSTDRFKTYYGVSLHPRQKFKRPPFWNGWSYGTRK